MLLCYFFQDGNLSRITGLDPSGPLFYSVAASERCKLCDFVDTSTESGVCYEATQNPLLKNGAGLKLRHFLLKYPCLFHIHIRLDRSDAQFVDIIHTAGYWVK